MASHFKEQKHLERQFLRGQRRKGQLYSGKFISSAHEWQFVENKRLIMERKMYLRPGEAMGFQDELRRRNWTEMRNHWEPVTIVVVKEFYVNAMVQEGSIPPYTKLCEGEGSAFRCCYHKFLPWDSWGKCSLWIYAIH